jgi:hypothetical protein
MCGQEGEVKGQVMADEKLFPKRFKEGLRIDGEAVYEPSPPLWGQGEKAKLIPAGVEAGCLAVQPYSIRFVEGRGDGPEVRRFPDERVAGGSIIIKLVYFVPLRGVFHAGGGLAGRSFFV